MASGTVKKGYWNISDEPFSELDCQFLASIAFPTLFPGEKGDPTNSALLHYYLTLQTAPPNLLQQI